MTIDALNKTWRHRALNTLNQLVKVKNPLLNLSLELIDLPPIKQQRSKKGSKQLSDMGFHYGRRSTKKFKFWRHVNPVIKTTCSRFLFKALAMICICKSISYSYIQCEEAKIPTSNSFTRCEQKDTFTKSFVHGHLNCANVPLFRSQLRSLSKISHLFKPTKTEIIGIN